MIDSIKVQFESDYREYGRSIYRYFYFRASSHETAEDLTSLVFSNFWKKRKEKLSIKNVKALLYTMAHGVLVDYYRSASRGNMVAIDLVNPTSMSIPDENLDNLEIEADIQRLMQYLDRLKEEYKEILVLYYIEEVKIKDIAKILDKKEASVRVLIHRALTSLKKIYEKYSTN